MKEAAASSTAKATDKAAESVKKTQDAAAAKTGGAHADTKAEKPQK